MTDLRLLTPFSNETRHSGFLQDLINTFPTPAMFAHRPPTHADGLTRALTASKYSPLLCRDVVRSCVLTTPQMTRFRDVQYAIIMATV